MDKEDIIANEGRKSISNFCIEECKSYCCRKGYLVMTKKQLDVVVNGKKEEYKEEIKEVKDKYSLFMGKSDKPCPSLNKDFRCNVHESPDRPKACGDFPLFLRKKSKTVLLSPRCLAVKLGMLYPYAKRLQMMGYKILRVNEVVDFAGIDLPNKILDEKTAQIKLKI